MVGACEPAASAEQSVTTADTAVPAPSRTPLHPAESAVRQIRPRFATTERELPRYRCRTLPLEGFSAEGGELQACYAGTELRKLTARHLGEWGRAEEQFFIWGQQIDFVYRVREQYDAPLSGRIASRSEERYYFVSGQLVRWLGDRNTPQPVDSAEAAKAAGHLLALARQLTSCAANRAAVSCAA